MPLGRPPAVGIWNSEIAPVGVILPILSTKDSVNHRFPSGPAVMPMGPLHVGISYSVIRWAAWVGAAVATINKAVDIGIRNPARIPTPCLSPECTNLGDRVSRRSGLSDAYVR
jgi:hypothetical protein